MKFRRSVCPNWMKASVLAGAAILAAGTCAYGDDLVVNNFDAEDEAASWARWWGNATQTYEFDSSVDANGSASSGSLKSTIGFDVAANTGDNQFAVVAGFPDGATVDGTLYTSLAFDIKWDASSPKRSSGDFGSLEFGFRKSDFSQVWLTPASPLNVPATNGWIHVVAPIDPSTAGLDQLTGVVLKMWSGDPIAGFTGNATFWLDNVKLIANTNTVQPPPSVSLQKANAGLRLFASQAGSQYQRQNIRTVVPAFSWVDAGQPVTYSLTIKDYPDSAHSGFQTHLFLVPGEALPNYETSPDYNEANIVFLNIQNQADGTGFASVHYKVNQPNGNSMIYNQDPANGPVGVLGGIGSAQITGTWSLTFSNATSITLTAPSGASTNLVMPADAAALFAGPLYAYFGAQPNQVGNINEGVTLSRVQITGVATPIDENFAGITTDTNPLLDLDATIWERVAENAPGVVLVPPDSAYWVNWTVPASGYTLQSSSTVTAGWTDPQLTGAQIGNRMRVIVPSSKLPSSGSGFFRLIKQ